MTGDYYTADLLSGSPRTSMIGNQIEFYLFARLAEGGRRVAGDHPLGAAARGDVLLPALGRPGVAGAAMRRLASWWEDPWRRPVFLATATWLYVLWSIVPVLIAIQFSFNAGRSRSAWQGFSLRWWWGDDDPLAAPRPDAAPGDAEQPRAGRADDAGRHAARGRARARPGPVARARSPAARTC